MAGLRPPVATTAAKAGQTGAGGGMNVGVGERTGLGVSGFGSPAHAGGYGAVGDDTFSTPTHGSAADGSRTPLVQRDGPVAKDWAPLWHWGSTTQWRDWWNGAGHYSDAAYRDRAEAQARIAAEIATATAGHAPGSEGYWAAFQRYLSNTGSFLYQNRANIAYTLFAIGTVLATMSEAPYAGQMQTGISTTLETMFGWSKESISNFIASWTIAGGDATATIMMVLNVAGILNGVNTMLTKVASASSASPLRRSMYALSAAVCIGAWVFGSGSAFDGSNNLHLPENKSLLDSFMSLSFMGQMFLYLSQAGVTPISSVDNLANAKFSEYFNSLTWSEWTKAVVGTVIRALLFAFQGSTFSSDPATSKGLAALGFILTAWMNFTSASLTPLHAASTKYKMAMEGKTLEGAWVLDTEAFRSASTPRERLRVLEETGHPKAAEFKAAVEAVEHPVWFAFRSLLPISWPGANNTNPELGHAHGSIKFFGMLAATCSYTSRALGNPAFVARLAAAWGEVPVDEPALQGKPFQDSMFALGLLSYLQLYAVFAQASTNGTHYVTDKIATLLSYLSACCRARCRRNPYAQLVPTDGEGPSGPGGDGASGVVAAGVRSDGSVNTVADHGATAPRADTGATPTDGGEGGGKVDAAVEALLEQLYAAGEGEFEREFNRGTAEAEAAFKEVEALMAEVFADIPEAERKEALEQIRAAIDAAADEAEEDTALAADDGFNEADFVDALGPEDDGFDEADFVDAVGDGGADDVYISPSLLAAKAPATTAVVVTDHGVVGEVGTLPFSAHQQANAAAQPPADLPPKDPASGKVAMVVADLHGAKSRVTTEVVPEGSAAAA